MKTNLLIRKVKILFLKTFIFLDFVLSLIILVSPFMMLIDYNLERYKDFNHFSILSFIGKLILATIVIWIIYFSFKDHTVKPVYINGYDVSKCEFKS